MEDSLHILENVLWPKTLRDIERINVQSFLQGNLVHVYEEKRQTGNPDGALESLTVSIMPWQWRSGLISQCLLYPPPPLSQLLFNGGSFGVGEIANIIGERGGKEREGGEG